VRAPAGAAPRRHHPNRVIGPAVRGRSCAWPEPYGAVFSESGEELRPASTRAVEVTDFVSVDDIDPIYYERTYWLAPADDAALAKMLRMANQLVDSLTTEWNRSSAGAAQAPGPGPQVSVTRARPRERLGRRRFRFRGADYESRSQGAVSSILS
jgi:hypothetical protein